MRQRKRLQGRLRLNDRGKLNNIGVSRRLLQLRQRKKDWKKKLQWLQRLQRLSVYVLKEKKLPKPKGKGFKKKSMKLVQEKRLLRKLRKSA